MKTIKETELNTATNIRLKEKGEILDRLKAVDDELKDIADEEANLKMAKPIKGFYDGLVASGFSEEQAFELVKIAMVNAIK